MVKKFLDDSGLSIFWNKVKIYIDNLGLSKADKDQVTYIGNTQVPINREQGELSLDGVNISGKSGGLNNKLSISVNNVSSGEFDGTTPTSINIEAGNVKYNDTEDIVTGIEETLVTNALRKTPQSLTSEEKNQVLTNFGINNIPGDILTLQSQMSTANDNITTLQEQIGTANNNINNIKTTTDRLAGSNSVTTLTNLPVNKALILASLSSATNISLQEGMVAGHSITVICTPSTDFDQPIPVAGNFISMDGESLKMTTGKTTEINIYCYNTNKYSISCKNAK